MSENYRVLHLVNGEFYAGAERVQDLLAQNLPGLGFDIEFVSLKDGLFATKRKSLGTPLTQIPMTSRFDMGVVGRLSAHLRARRFDLLHTHTPRTALIGSMAARQTGIPMVHHVHSPAGKDTENAWRNRINSLVERFTLRYPRKLIPVSASLAANLRDRGFDPAGICMVPNGVPMQPKSRQAYLPSAPLVIGAVALFRPRKGIEILLEAVAMLNAMGHDVTLRAIGPFETGDYYRDVRRLADRLGIAGKVVWTDFVADVSAELAKVHLFVLPSLFGEGLPMVLLEAMSIGLPVVATDVEGVPEVVRDRQDGILVKPGSASDLAKAIRHIYTGDYNAAALGDSAWLWQRANFSDMRMAERVAEVYKDVLRQ